MPHAPNNGREILCRLRGPNLAQKFQLCRPCSRQERLDQSLLRPKQKEQHPWARTNRLRQWPQRQAREPVLEKIGIRQLEQLNLPARGGSTLRSHCTTFTETVVSVKPGSLLRGYSSRPRSG